MFQILIVEDDKELSQLFQKVLEKNGYQVKSASDGAQALEVLDKEYIDLIISDIMMPVMDGYELVSELRSAGYQIPVLMITAKGSFDDMRQGFFSGSDDYMVKPVELAELEMRVRALLRRANIEMERKLVVANLELDADGMTASIDGEEISITTREFHILYKLLSYPKKTFTRAQLMDEFWGIDSGTSLRAVDVYITKLRDKFSACNGFEIKTVRGLGYKAVLL
mgnify:CR=1 FL=1